MRSTIVRLAVALVVVGAAISFSSGPAMAKGATEVSIAGPGLATPLQVSDDGAGPSAIMPNQLADASGALFAVLRSTPSPIVSARPPGPLGPRYRVVYQVMTGAEQFTPVRQDVYPFARAGFVTYTPPGQHAFHKSVRSGWYLSAVQGDPGSGMSSEAATALFVSAGVPGRPTA
jgi:hypothetical protein